MNCKHILWNMRRKTILIAAISMIVYASLTIISAVLSKGSKKGYNDKFDELRENPTITGAKIIERHIKLQAEKLKYLFWTWSALTSAITFCFDIVLLVAAILRSNLFAHMYLSLLTVMTFLNLTPIMIVIEIDSGLLTLFGILTALIFAHRLLNCTCVWFLLKEIKKYPDGPPKPPPSPKPSVATVKPKPLVKPKTEPNSPAMTSTTTTATTYDHHDRMGMAQSQSLTRNTSAASSPTQQHINGHRV